MSEPVKPRASRRTKILLGVSLALNLAVVGLIAGTAWRFDGPGKRFPHAPAAGSYAVPYVKALSPEDRRVMFRELRSAERSNLPDRAARRAHYADVLAAIRSTPFDAQAARAALDAQRDSTLAVQSATQDIWITHIGAMSAEDRADYANRVEEELRHGANRKDKKKD